MIKKIFTYFFRKSFLIYGVIGVFVTLSQVSVLFLLRNYFYISDFFSITIAYIFALILHFFLNKHITFLIDDRKVFNMMSVRYILVVIISYLIYISSIYVWKDIIGVSFTVALLITLAFNYVVNYWLYEKIVFVQNRGLGT
ncbi:MAG: GtrA-like protein [Bacillales bacterium]|jgi:putative flippase GtrA|nr:GtrA-like protein [Bacillales bacterium]